MTLEDFFTLTEMKDGLTAPSRVHELVAVMQKEKDCVVKNVGDATRQWAAVASTIAATESKDCLDLFVKLDGLWFIDRWLKDAHKFSNDAPDSFIEESLTALLRALEKLQIDKERSASSGIWITVNNLLHHNSSRIQDRARALFNSWTQDRLNNTFHHDFQCVRTYHNTSVLSSDNSRAESVDVPLPKGSGVIENSVAYSARDENSKSNSDSLQSERVEDVQLRIQGDMEDKFPDHLLKQKPSNSTVEGTALTETHSVPVTKGENTDSELESSKTVSSFSDNSCVIASPSSKVEPGVSSADAAPKEESAKPALLNNADVKEGDLGSSVSASGDAGISVSTKAGPDDVGVVNHSSTLVFKSMAKDESSLDTLEDSFVSGRKLEKPENERTSLSRMEAGGVADDDREHSSDGAEALRDDYDFSRPTTDTQSPDPINRKRSDIELEYGMVDALEVARQVAQEVEREVVDHREPSCSSCSEEAMKIEIMQSGGLDSMNAKKGPCIEVPQEDLPTGQNQSVEVHPGEDGHLGTLHNVENEADNATQELESSQVTEVAPEPEANMGNSLCDFDLNQEVCSDDVDHPAISVPISVVSASRPAAASGSPSMRLQFEGVLGWKGSASTSAFRPASPRKTSDGDKTIETGITSCSSKQRQGSLVIDLNVAEDGDENVMDLISRREIVVSSGLHSGESSLEMGSRRSERLNLDLNQISDDCDALASGLRMQGQQLYPCNGHHNPSPASSSSSMQPSLRNIDLNDRPLFSNDLSDQGLYRSNQNPSVREGSKPGDPVISIMGTIVEVGKRDIVQQNQYLPNGKPMDSAMGANVARMGGVLGIPAVSYTHSPVFGYNGLTTAPTVYGPGASLPYMVDTRGAPVVPHVLGSATTVPLFSQPSFVMGMTGSPVSLNGAAASRPNFDLNSGYAIETGNPGGLRQLFMPGQRRSTEDHLRINSQPSSSSGMGAKRREPDGGWESYSLPYKHLQPPWR